MNSAPPAASRGAPCAIGCWAQDDALGNLAHVRPPHGLGIAIGGGRSNGPAPSKVILLAIASSSMVV
jgi:hypothetical protein